MLSSIGILAAAIKHKLGFEADDDEDEENLQNDIRSYTEIINSPRYADSNASTEALERLLKAANAGAPIEPKSAVDNGWAPANAAPASQATGETDHQANGQNEADKAAPKLDAKEQPHFRFSDRLQEHLKLIEELEKDVLPAQPLRQPAKFGKVAHQKFYLQRFDIPKWVWGALENNDKHALGLNSAMAPENYVHRFQTLLWLEEAHQAVEMRRYDQHDTLLGKFENFFIVPVPGLAEGRPSLMSGDRLLLRNPRRGTTYEGYIYEVREFDVKIKLHESLSHASMDGVKFDVSFLNSRTPYRRCHTGVLQVKHRPDIKAGIFPSVRNQLAQPLIPLKETKAEEMRCFRKEMNIYQKRAIFNVLKSECRPAPYVIFGPCGTGKTVTLVEAALQVYFRMPKSKILLVGNSNACADILAEQILDSKVVREKELVRVSAFYRMEKLVPPKLADITMDMDMISHEDYKRFRVVVSTCIQSGALYEFPERFDFVFVDEAGHAGEPEALISFGLLHVGGSCVLAGDHQQLGPVCLSNLANFNGLGRSMLERLSARAVYQRRTKDSKMVYDEKYITKLLTCYRSDPRVLTVNNELFYHNELKCVNKTPKFWMDFFKLENPLVFHRVKGKDRREYVNPSWFNPNEAVTCLCYVKKLYGAGLKPEQLGIITPYRRQIEKLNILFDSLGLQRCKIATMEEFQGDEREVIIISTVRTRKKNLEFDKQFNLGFLFNPKRFNVAISRAKWLVFVVGDAEILKQDPCWVKYIENAHNLGEPSDSA